MRPVKQANVLHLATAACLVALSGCGGSGGGGSDESSALQVLSSRPDYVTGGDALVAITVPTGRSLQAVRVNGSNVTTAFKTSPATGQMVGLLTGLRSGENTVEASFGGGSSDASTSTLRLTNYPITGPVISGPQDQTFICQTSQFYPTTTTNANLSQTPMPGSTTLGPALDANCSFNARVDHVYRTTAGEWKLLPSLTTSVPADAARTTTSSGVNVPFVIRIDTKPVNRGIYQSAVLFNPISDTVPTPTTPPAAWNKRLVAIHGYGCTGGWYLQGARQGNLALAGTAQELLDVRRLGQGYATFTNTLQHPSNNCNALLGAETAMMSKETFVEQYGAPAWTLSHGTSGGSYTSTRYTDIVPGLFDGIVISATFPDPNSLALNALDAHLITHYEALFPDALTDTQVVAVTGFRSVRAMTDLANQAGRADPVPGRQDVPGYTSGVFNALVPASSRYHPFNNPRGLRPTVWDWERNIAGVDPATGFARRPYDNVGVQYGLRALNTGAITKQQFLDLNERIGGYDQDQNYVAARSSGDHGAIRRYYETGVHMSGGGGLASIPTMNVGGSNEDAGYHYSVFHFAARERLREANGDADNFVMWRGNPPYDEAFDTMAAWIEAYKNDQAGGSQREKVLRNKPARAVDSCFTTAGAAIQEPQTLSSAANSQCNTLFPTWELTRIVAGGPVSMNNVKCQLKPITASDYTVVFTAPELARLQQIFSSGVCDWSKPGVSQVPIIPLPSLGPAPQNRIAN